MTKSEVCAMASNGPKKNREGKEDVVGHRWRYKFLRGHNCNVWLMLIVCVGDVRNVSREIGWVSN